MLYCSFSAFSFNPGRIDPTNAAWTDSRKPLAAMWRTSSGNTLFTVNLHLVSKDGGTTGQVCIVFLTPVLSLIPVVQGDARPPVNLPVAQRTSQVETVAVRARTEQHFSLKELSSDVRCIHIGKRPQRECRCRR
jgi:hypothetical protein